MRRFLIAFLMAVCLLSSAIAVEPSIVLSLGIPGMIRFSEFEPRSSYDIAGYALSDNELYILSIPQRVVDAELKLANAFSFNPVKSGGFAISAYGIFKARDTFNLDSGSGSLELNRSIDYRTGSLNIIIGYDNIKMNYAQDNDIRRMDLDGDVAIRLSLFVDPVAVLRISTGRVSFSGDASASNGDVEIIIKTNEKAMKKYQKRDDWNDRRKEAIDKLRGMEFLEWENLGLSSSSSYDEFLRFAERNNASDLIDFLAVFCIESDAEIADKLDVFSKVCELETYVDGKLDKDIKLSSAVNVAKIVMGVIS